MSKTKSTMIPLGTQAPHFELVDVVSMNKVQLTHNNNTLATVICFICNHCPYVKHINKQLTQVANKYLAKGVRFLAISSNDATQYPDDSPENMKKTASLEQYPFPYLYDETQEVAQAYQAACTPDFFVFDKELNLVYRGQFDDSRPGNNIPVTGASVTQTLDYILANKPLDFPQKPSMGCNIKWFRVM